MQLFWETAAKSDLIGKDKRSDNGLSLLAAYYHSLFDIDENVNHYSRNDYQNAKRKFVQHLMKNRSF